MTIQADTYCASGGTILLPEGVKLVPDYIARLEAGAAQFRRDVSECGEELARIDRALKGMGQ